MVKEDKIISYKGFDNELKCHGFQYEVGKEYETDGEIQCCYNGFHACGNPLEVLDYFFMKKCELARFCLVEQSGKLDRGNSGNTSKVASSKIRIISELSIYDLVEAGFKWIKGHSDLTDYISNKSLHGHQSKIFSSSNNDKISVDDRYKQIVSTGDSSQICCNSHCVNIVSNGHLSLVCSNGDYVEISSGGYGSKIVSNGEYVNICSCGEFSHICSTGDYANISSSGDFSDIYSSGNNACISFSGCYAHISSSGNNCIICCSGCGSRVKAKKGSWITLSEWGNDEQTRVKTEYVDGEHIKEDTWYKLINGEFKEVGL